MTLIFQRRHSAAQWWIEADGPLGEVANGPLGEVDDCKEEEENEMSKDVSCSPSLKFTHAFSGISRVQTKEKAVLLTSRGCPVLL